MTPEQLAAELLHLAGESNRQAWLEQHRHHLDEAFMAALQARVEELKLKDPGQAMRVAGVAQEAAAQLGRPEARALALWMRGTAAMHTGDFQVCADAYREAEDVYARLGDRLTTARLQSFRVFALTFLGRQEDALALAETARQGLIATGHEQSIHAAKLEMNLGVACRQAGRYEEALAAYERGRAIFAGLGDRVQVARMDINRAKALEKLDRFREAATLLESARAVLLAEGATLDLPRADLNLGHLAFGQGQYRPALEIYGRARQGFAALDNELEVAAVDFHRAQVYLALNLFNEGQTLAETARQVFTTHGMNRYATQAMTWEAAAARGLEEFDTALALFDQARAELERRGEMLEVAFVDLQRVALLRKMGPVEIALATARTAANTMEQHQLSVRLAQARLLMADCLFDLAQTGEAASLYQTALAVAEKQALATLLYRARFGLGRVAEVDEARQTAAAHYETAISHLEAIHRDLQVDEFQAGFMDDKLAVYEAAVRLALAQGDIETAFDYVERARAGALLELLARGLDLAPPDQTTGDLLAQLQALRADWHWQTSRLEGRDPDEPEPPTRAGETVRRETVRRIERQLSELWRELRLRSASIPGLLPARLSLADIQARLPEETLLLEYYAVDGQMVAFPVSSGQAGVVELGVSLEELEQLIGTWRFDLGSLQLMLPDLSPAEITALAHDSRSQLQQLYDLLVAPLSGRLAGHRRLIVAPHLALHHLPLAALHNGRDYLGDCFAVSYLPAASLLAKAGPPAPAGRPLILGHSAGGILPHTLAEARQIASLLDGAQLFLEEEATEARLRQEGPTCGLLHLATHATFRTDNPMFSWLQLADARLTVQDVYQLRLPQTALVTLSACETGLGDLRGGDVLGLSHSFLAAGAGSLLLSLWAVDDASTAGLMTAFYRNLAAGHHRAAALSAAQQSVRMEYPHPFYWAGFILIG